MEGVRRSKRLLLLQKKKQDEEMVKISKVTNLTKKRKKSRDKEKIAGISKQDQQINSRNLRYKSRLQRKEICKTVPPKKRFKGLVLQKENTNLISSDHVNNIQDNVGVMIQLPSNQSLLNEKKEVIDWSEWKSASSLKNYMMDDSFIDVILYNKGSCVITGDPAYTRDVGKMIAATNSTNNFVSTLLNQGNIFENKVIELLKQELGEKNTIYIGNNARSQKLYEATVKAIHSGIPVIFQAVLRNYSNKTYGVADILMRSDWINSFLDVNALSEEEAEVSASKLAPSNFYSKISKVAYSKKRENYHYVVIDIKYKTLPLRADGIHLRNDSNLKFYKSQLLIYTEALGEIQGYTCPYAFILGSKWKYEKQGQKFEGKSCFSRLGKIDYLNLDNSYIKKTQLALNWLDDVRENTYDLSSYPLARDEMYPNLCNRMDYPYHNIKRKYAEAHNDLTLLWNVGPKQRRIANSKGVYDWRDEKCTAAILGVNGKVKGKVLQKILDINHSEVHTISPKYILNNYGDWKNKTGRKIELYVDFETTCSVFNDLSELPLNNTSSKIFLIGAGYIHPISKEWVYNRFIVNKLTDQEEARICREFVNFINLLKKKYKCDNIFAYHWSHAEISAWKRFEKRNHQKYEVNWYDLLKVFMKEPITIKGALSFSLKNIVKAFYEHGFIETHYGEDLECTNGSDAAVSAYKASIECEKEGILFSNHHISYEIVKYNEIDCKSMCDIILYLRKNHVALNDEVEEIDSSSETEIRTMKRRRVEDISESI